MVERWAALPRGDWCGPAVARLASAGRLPLSLRPDGQRRFGGRSRRPAGIRMTRRSIVSMPGWPSSSSIALVALGARSLVRLDPGSRDGHLTSVLRIPPPGREVRARSAAPTNWSSVAWPRVTDGRVRGPVSSVAVDPIGFLGDAATVACRTVDRRPPDDPAALDSTASRLKSPGGRSVAFRPLGRRSSASGTIGRVAIPDRSRRSALDFPSSRLASTCQSRPRTAPGAGSARDGAKLGPGDRRGIVEGVGPAGDRRSRDSAICSRPVPTTEDPSADVVVPGRPEPWRRGRRSRAGTVAGVVVELVTGGVARRSPGDATDLGRASGLLPGARATCADRRTGSRRDGTRWPGSARPRRSMTTGDELDRAVLAGIEDSASRRGLVTTRCARLLGASGRVRPGPSPASAVLGRRGRLSDRRPDWPVSRRRGRWRSRWRR